MKNVKMTLSKKILLIFLFGILFPVLVFACLFYGSISYVMKERVEGSIAYSVNMVKEHIDDLAQDTEEIAISVGVGDAMQSALQKEYHSYDEFYEVYNSPVTNFIKEIATTTQGIYKIGIYTNNPTIYNSSILAHISEEPQIEEWINELKTSGDTMYISSRLEYENGIEQNGILRPQIISCFRVPPSKVNYTYEMIICIEWDIEQIYEWIQENEEGIIYYLLNEKNQIVASTNKMYEPMDMDDFVTYDEIPHDEPILQHTVMLDDNLEGWRLIGETRERLLMEEVSKITFMFTVMIVLVLLFSAGVFYFLIRPYTTRLTILSKRMERFSTENLSPVVTRPYHDEVEVVIQNYNQMMAEMDELINKVYALNMQKTELELNQVKIQMDQLLNQVNPHFLFNTLNAILNISEKNNYTEVSWAIEHLALMMRKLLNWSQDKVTIEEELDFIRMYLDIEKLRFAEQFDYVIEADENVKLIQIPKMSIQPLVENACKHGIHKKNGYGKVIVRITCVEDILFVNILDTGTALTKEQIDQIKTYSAGVGLKNVYHRLNLYYGDRAEITIENRGEYNCFGFWIQMKGETYEKDHTGR